ncbi:hypothetical protein F4859DRAFT_516044 [Xylaria cf. heliscus]|nr:hypothetical protein F4859DRAFT_516044 [Xylaria cf. heliscus]
MENAMAMALGANPASVVDHLVTLDMEELQHELRPLLNSDVDIPQDTVLNAWHTHLTEQGLASSFMPLEGTERDRYGDIIEEALSEERYEVKVGCDTVLQLTPHKVWTRADLINKYGPQAKSYSLNSPVTSDDVFEFAILERRHIKHWFDFDHGIYQTPYGRLKACFVLPANHWYLGHRPGDPVVRVGNERTGVPFFNMEGHSYFIPQLDGPGDDNVANTYQVHFEGVVPFNDQELNLRLREYVFPRFLKMVLGIVSFDARTPKHDAHPWITGLTARVLGIQAAPERQKVNTIRLLRTMWSIKFGDRGECPNFFTDQIGNAISAIREAGWLIQELEGGSSRVRAQHYWSHFKRLIQDVTGCDIPTLAEQYKTVQLAGETKRLLEAGQVDDIVVYTQSQQGLESERIANIYARRGPDYPVTFQQILQLRQVLRLPLPPREPPPNV